MATSTKTAKSADADKPCYELKYRDKSSDGTPYDEQRYPEGYVPIREDHDKHREWLTKLASMFSDFVGLDKSRVYFFKGFPEGYHLRCKDRVKGAGKGPDYYLYGWPNPEGTPKPFKSPNDFFPHLLWLSSGNRDRKLCVCRLCREISSRKEQPDQTFAVESSHPTSSLPPGITISSQAPSTRIQPQAPSRTQSQAPVKTLPPLRKRELFRVGEVVWYQLGTAWRLGIILAEEEPAGPQAGTRWTIRPLGHRYFEGSQDVTKYEKELRPYLAFSVPSINPALAPRFEGKPMNEIDWQSTQQEITGGDRQKQVSLSLEASKVAATTVDHSYSTFNYVPNGSAVEQFGGVFLGCERIERGDAVRIWYPSEEQELGLVLLVKNILVNDQVGLCFEGDLYCLKPPTSTDELPLAGTRLSPDMEEEAATWNQVKARQGVHVAWVFKRSVTLREDAIRGRFYPTFKLRKLIDPARLERDLQSGVVEGVQAYLNNRRGSQGRYIVRWKNRLDTVKEALPQGPLPVPIGPNMFGPGIHEDV